MHLMIKKKVTGKGEGIEAHPTAIALGYFWLAVLPGVTSF